MLQLFKPNLAVIQQQATLARKYAEENKLKGKFLWGDLVQGVNVMRILPATNSRGIIGKKVAKHYYGDTVFSSHDPETCPLITFADMPDCKPSNISCPIHDVGDKILSMFPQLDIRRWHNAGLAWYVQAINRQDTDPSTMYRARMYRLTPATYNSLIIEMECLLQQGVDMTDLQQGMDIRIVVSTKVTKGKGKGGKPRTTTSYELGLWNARGPTTLHDDPSVVTQILESMVDMDKVWSPPDDEEIASLASTAAEIHNHYMKNSYAPGMVNQFNGRVTTPAMTAPVHQYPVQNVPQANAAPSYQQASPYQVPQATPPRFVPNQQVQVAQQPQVTVQQSPALIHTFQQSELVNQVQVPQQPGSQVVLSPQLTVKMPAPTDKPSCFGGSTARADGQGVGYSEDSEACLMCKYELQCMDACNKR